MWLPKVIATINASQSIVSRRYSCEIIIRGLALFIPISSAASKLRCDVWQRQTKLWCLIGTWRAVIRAPAYILTLNRTCSSHTKMRKVKIGPYACKRMTVVRDSIKLLSHTTPAWNSNVLLRTSCQRSIYTQQYILYIHINIQWCQRARGSVLLGNRQIAVRYGNYGE